MKSILLIILYILLVVSLLTDHMIIYCILGTLLAILTIYAFIQIHQNE